MTLVTLVCGGDASLREEKIASLLAPGRRNAVIIEGLAGTGTLDSSQTPSPDLTVVRIAPGCPCCTGKLTMRVTLNRVLREHPDQLFLSLANNEHLASVINLLQEDQYRRRLEISQPVDCSIPGTGFANTGY